MTPLPSRDRKGAVPPGDVDELAETLARCGAAGRTVELGGHFTKQSMGGPIAPAEVILSTAKLCRVVEYEPRDLTISVEAGLRFGALQDLLRENNQMLPLDPPCAEEATVGGVLAANCSGPRRRLYGGARDMVIGMTFVTLEGKQVRSGGMVVKNVAGLDMAKLLIGSFGSLAAIARVNFKVFPRPPQERTFVLSFPSVEAALQARDAVLRSVLQPAAIDLANPAAVARLAASLPAGYALLIEAGGIAAVIARCERELNAIARETAAAFLAVEPEQERPLWQAVRDFPAAGGAASPSGAVLRLSTTLARLADCFQLAGELPALARAGSGVTYIHAPAAVAGLAARARSAGLYAVVESCAAEDKGKLELWADPGPEIEIMTRIKQALDPRHLLNHGRLYNRL